MAIERLGTENDPDVKVSGSSIKVEPDVSREEQISNAAQILVNEEELLLDQEIQEQTAPTLSFNANLVEFINPNILQKYRMTY